MNFEQARYNMIEQQIRPWEVLDQNVLDLIAKVRREDFVPARHRKLAFTDMLIPLGRDQVMMSPKMEARMVQSLAPAASDDILEIGTGSGYVTALLASSGKHVVSVEYFEDFTRGAADKLKQNGLSNVTLEVGDAVNGWTQHAPYDVIAVTGSMSVYRKALQEQLRVGGRLFVIVGETPVMEARLITRIDHDDWSVETLFETDLPPLIGAARVEQFVF